MMSQIIKTILAIIGIIFGGLLILGVLIDGAAWRFLMGLAFLGPAVWWFMTKPGQRRWKAVIPLALLSFFVGAGMAPSTKQEQPAAAVMATPSSSSTPTTTKKTTTSRPTTTSRTTTATTTSA
ncbi:MAG: calcium-binding protein, partial [Corynebacterium matruchotii]